MKSTFDLLELARECGRKSISATCEPDRHFYSALERRFMTIAESRQHAAQDKQPLEAAE